MTHRGGEMTETRSLRALSRLLAELDADDDPEHFEVAVSAGDDWVLSVMAGGDVYWGDVERDSDDPPGSSGCLRDVPRAEALALMRLVALRDRAALARVRWLPEGS